MRKIFLIAFTAIALMGFIKPDSGTITIHLKEIKSQEGEIVFMLFNKEDGFPKEPEMAFKKGVVKEFSGSASYSFTNVPYGTYAVSVFHDKDKDGTIKSNFIGMPKEPVGASNMTKMGKPSYDKCSFQLNTSTKELNMKFIIE